MTSRKSIAAREQDAWAALCADVVTNRIYQVVVDIKSAVTNETPFNPRLLSVTPLAYHCRPVTNAVLTGPANPDPRRRSKATAREMRTETDSHTGLAFAVGGLSPGEIVDEVPSNGVVRLENCVLRNRTDERWPENGLYYVLEGRARLCLERKRVAREGVGRRSFLAWPCQIPPMSCK